MQADVYNHPYGMNPFASEIVNRCVLEEKERVNESAECEHWQDIFFLLLLRCDTRVHCRLTVQW